eukprot:2862356-Pyramimonas_sp.AAC.1
MDWRSFPWRQEEAWGENGSGQDGKGGRGRGRKKRRGQQGPPRTPRTGSRPREPGPGVEDPGKRWQCALCGCNQNLASLTHCMHCQEWRTEAPTVVTTLALPDVGNYDRKGV